MFGLLNRIRAKLSGHMDYCVKCRKVNTVYAVKTVVVKHKGKTSTTRQGRCSECDARTSVFVAA
jgi:hypothetical protein